MKRLLAMMLLVPAALAAQAPDAGTFRIWQGGMEVGRETFRSTAREFSTDVIVPIARVRIASVIQRDDAGRAVRLDERVYTLPADTVVVHYEAERDADSMRVTQVGGVGLRRWHRPGPLDGFLPDQSIASLLPLVTPARHDTTLYVWLPNADTTFALALVVAGDTIRATLGPQILTFIKGPDARVRTVLAARGNVRFDRHLAGDLPALPNLTPPHPDYSAPADAAYTADSVRVSVTGLQQDTFSLGCTLTKPKSGGSRFPAAITLTGSGQQDRDENLYPLTPDYRLFRQVAERLAAEGIAVLRCDDHGVFQSGGRLDTATSMLDFVNDAQAEIQWLRARADIDPARIAVIGHSEGGITGPMIAAQDPRLRALVVLAGPSKTMNEVLHDQFLAAVDRTEGLTPAQRAAARADAIREADAFGSNAPGYMRFARTYDPSATARRVRTPTLILQGRLDRQVTAGQADSLAAAMRAGGNRDVTVRIFDTLNHLFLVSPSGTGSPEEYATLAGAAAMVPREVLDTLAAWLKHRLR